jgi:hypothetical protein
VIDAGSVTAGLILLRLEIEVPEVDPDASFNAVILVMSLRIRFVCLLWFMLLYLDLFWLHLLAVLLHSFVASLDTELLSFPSRPLSELLQR